MDARNKLSANSAATETHLFRLQKEAFDEVIADRYEIAQNIIQVLVERLRATVLQGA